MRGRKLRAIADKARLVAAAAVVVRVVGAHLERASGKRTAASLGAVVGGAVCARAALTVSEALDQVADLAESLEDCR